MSNGPEQTLNQINQIKMTYTSSVKEGQIQSDGSVLGPEQTLSQSSINVKGL